MIVTLDGEKLEQGTNGTTLRGLLDRVRSEHLGDRLIVSVAVDGETLSDDQLQVQLGAPVSDGVQIDLETGERGPLVCDALRGLAQEFHNAIATNQQLVDRLNAGQIAEGVRGVADIVQLWQMCHRTIGQCSGLLETDLTQLVTDGATLDSRLQTLIEKLGELREALEAQDIVLLGDIVQYELTPLCETWHQVLNGLAEQVAHAAQPA